MHIATTASDARPVSSGSSLDRRSLVKGGLALGALALAAPLMGGCALLGIEDPNAAAPEEEPVAVPGTVDFEGLMIAATLDTAMWTWEQINNVASPHHGSIVVGIPVSATNNDEGSRVLNSMYCKIYSPDGTVQADISSYYTANDILQLQQRGGIGSGSMVTGVLHMLYQGAGTYTVEFDDLMGGKADLLLEVGAAPGGLSAIPATQMSAADAANAVAYGQPFEVSGLTMTFSPDELAYTWEQSWDEGNAVWNGRWCVGVPLTVTNGSTAPVTVTNGMYGLYAPGLYRLDDPAPWFTNRSLAYVGAIAPGQTVQTMLWWPYDSDGNYYAIFDSNGRKSVASVHFVNS